MQSKEEAFAKLSKSKFRIQFRIDEKDRVYIEKKGMECIRNHAEDFVEQRLASAYPKNDGKQTPMRGHPVFKAMHACACCCRGCLYKWYRIPPDVPLRKDQQERIVNFLMAWIEKQL